MFCRRVDQMHRIHARQTLAALAAIGPERDAAVRELAVVRRLQAPALLARVELAARYASTPPALTVGAGTGCAVAP